MDILIRSALVQDGQPPLDIGIREGVIYKLAPRIDDPAAQVLDAAGRATIPGLIEPHIHLDKALLESRLANRSGTLEEAIRVTGILKTRQEYSDVLDRSRQVMDMAVRNGTVAMRCHPDVDTIQGLIGVETLVHLRKEYAQLIDLQIDQLCVLLSEVNESFDTDQPLDRVHIRMASHGHRAVTHCHVHNLTRPIKDVAVFLSRFEDAGHANRLFQCAGPIRQSRFQERLVEVNMRFNQTGYRSPSSCIEDLHGRLIDSRR